MFIIISSNLESYEDRREEAILACMTEAHAKLATSILRKWVYEANNYILEHPENSRYMSYDDYRKNIADIPFKVDEGSLHLPGVYNAYPLKMTDLKQAFYYYEIPEWDGKLKGE